MNDTYTAAVVFGFVILLVQAAICVVVIHPRPWFFVARGTAAPCLAVALMSIVVMRIINACGGLQYPGWPAATFDVLGLGFSDFFMFFRLIQLFRHRWANELTKQNMAQQLRDRGVDVDAEMNKGEPDGY